MFRDSSHWFGIPTLWQRSHTAGVSWAPMHRGLVSGIGVVALLVMPGSAAANHHFVKIAEVYPGTAGNPNLEYVELEMTASGQNQFSGSGTTVTFFDSTGFLVASGSVSLSGGPNPANAQSGRRILVGSASGTAADDVGQAFNVPPDFTFPASGLMDPAGGAVCFDPKQDPRDCVSWGDFATTPINQLISPAGSNVAAIPGNETIQRNRKTCTRTLIDTNDGSDWAVVPAAEPNNNSDNPPGVVPCPNTTIKSGPKGSTTDRTPTFNFKSSQAGSTFKCKIDSKAYASCTRPKTLARLKLGKHTFKVKASAGGLTDPTPATRKFTVKKKPRHRHRRHH